MFISVRLKINPIRSSVIRLCRYSTSNRPPTLHKPTAILARLKRITRSKLSTYDIEHQSRSANVMAATRYTPVMRTCLACCRNPTSSTTSSSTTTATATSTHTAASKPTATVARANILTCSTRSSFSTSARLRGGGSHENHYNPPTGWLWGIPPGQKYEKEGWEGLMYWGFCGSFALAAIAYIYKPDSR